MKKKLAMGFIAGIAILSLSMVSEAKSKRSSYSSQPAGDVEYNATENSPTLPLVQTPPPQNYPNSVVVGAPSYYYYYPQSGYYGGGGSGYYGGGAPLPVQGGAGFFNVNGNTVKSFWGTAGIPGQVAPYGGGGYGPGYGGPGYGGYGSGYGGYGPGFYPYGGNIGFTP